MVLLAALLVLVVGVYPDPIIALANQAQMLAPLHLVLQ